MELSEYRIIAASLKRVDPVFPECPDCSILLQLDVVEPLEGRSTLEVDRTCILRCTKCGKRYLTKYD